MFQTGSQRAESGGRYESCLKDSSSECQLDALPENAHEHPFDCTLLAGEGKGRTSQTLHLTCGPVLSIQECGHEGEKGGCNQSLHLCLLASLTFLPSLPGKGFTSNRASTAWAGQCNSNSWGHVSLTRAWNSEMGEFSFPDLLGESWSWFSRNFSRNSIKQEVTILLF